MTEILETESTVSTYNSTVSVEFNTSPIYKMKEALSLTFQPPDILHREKEMVEQREILNDVFRHTRPQNTMCFGEAMLMKTVNQLPRKPLVKEHLLNPSLEDRSQVHSFFLTSIRQPRVQCIDSSRDSLAGLMHRRSASAMRRTREPTNEPMKELLGWVD